ncbi:MAG: class I SAM-dependent methyltransferase [Actinomycetota bacterium]|nr:class I SAM-dependent methyltransferase [Actinomycetota bacterium]
MITGDTLSKLLHALATGYYDRAVNLVSTVDELDDDERRVLLEALATSKTRAGQARDLGDAFLAMGTDQAIVNECYRCAFYLSDAWESLSGNPMYAYFSANRSGSILDKWIHYFPIYTKHLDRFRGRPVRVLEIGVYRGGGLSMLAHYLGPSARLVGLDVDEAAVRAVHDRFPVILGDQEDPAVLRKLSDEHGPFDVIIDDGGHTMQQQIVTIETLFPLLQDGGVFLVEDCHTSYWSEFGGGLRKPDTFIEWAKLRVDDLHSRHERSIDNDSVWATAVDGVHVYDSVVVLEKQQRFRPFNEVAGTSSYLFGGRFSEIVGNELLATRDAALAERNLLVSRLDGHTDGPAAPAVGPDLDAERELILLRAELQKARGQIAEASKRSIEIEQELTGTRNELLESWQLVKQMRRTASWRVTTPLRALRRARRG